MTETQLEWQKPNHHHKTNWQDSNQSQELLWESKYFDSLNMWFVSKSESIKY